MINPIITIIIPMIIGFLMPVIYKFLKNKANLLLISVFVFNIVVLFFLLPIVADKPYMVTFGNVKPPFGIVLFFTFFSTLLSIIVNVFALFIVFMKLNKENNYDNEKVFLTVFSIVIAGTVSIINTMDIFNVFVFIEILTISSYILAGLKKQKNTDISVIKFITGTSIGSLFFLLGISVIYKLTGTLNILDMHSMLLQPEFNTFLFSTGLFLLMAGMFFELYLFPGNIFVIDIYAYSSPISGAIFSGIILTGVMYIFIKIFTLLSISPIFNNLLLVLAVITFISGELSALASKNHKRTLGFSSFGQAGLIVALLAINNLLGNNGELYHLLLLLLIIHAFSKFLMFFALNKFVNEDGKIINGFKNYPLSVIGFILGVLVLTGIPPFPGFFVKFNLIIELLRVNYLWFVIIILFCALIEIIYLFRIIRKLFIEFSDNITERITMIFPIALMILSIILVSFNPNTTLFQLRKNYKNEISSMEKELIKTKINKSMLRHNANFKE